MANISRNHVGVLLHILGWYLSSTLLVTSNKFLFDYLGLSVPLLVTFIHFSITSFFMVIIQRRSPESFGAITVTREEFLRWILPVAVCTAGDVGLSNMAYSRLPISVMTILKSSAPVCIYTAAIVFRIEAFRIKTALICVVIATSVAFAVPDSSGGPDKEYEYMSGIILIMIAVLCLAIRWVFVQTLTRRYSPLQLMYLIQPTSALVLVPFALIIDCDRTLVTRMTTGGQILPPILLILGSSLAAMALLFLEYRIVHHTSSLTLSIAGIGKEILTLCLSAIVFEESFTTRQIVAIGVSIVGILIYSVIRSRETDHHLEPPSMSKMKPNSTIEFGRLPSGESLTPPSLSPVNQARRTISTLSERSPE